MCVGGGGGGGGDGGLNYTWPQSSQSSPLVHMATILAFSSAVVYTRHLLSPREGFLTHQGNIFENIKIKRIQR